MKINKKEIIKLIQSDLKSKYPGDIISQSKCGLFDFSVLTLKKDIFYKVIFDNQYSNLQDLRDFIRSSYVFNSYISREYYLVVYSIQKKNFHYIKV